jgi:hypothetical protein
MGTGIMGGIPLSFRFGNAPWGVWKVMNKCCCKI